MAVTITAVQPDSQRVSVSIRVMRRSFMGILLLNGASEERERAIALCADGVILLFVYFSMFRYISREEIKGSAFPHTHGLIVHACRRRVKSKRGIFPKNHAPIL